MYLLSADPLTALLAVAWDRLLCPLQYRVEYGVEYGRASLKPPVLSCFFNPSRVRIPSRAFLFYCFVLLAGP